MPRFTTTRSNLIGSLLGSPAVVVARVLVLVLVRVVDCARPRA
ncbi:MAG TPA: hypothetical protein VF339_08590 [Gammaproteobacteria bacterium]